MVNIPEDMQEPYALLFFKKGKSSYLSSAPILEPQVYEFVHAVYDKNAIEPHLHQFAPPEVDVKWLPVEGKFVVTAKP